MTRTSNIVRVLVWATAFAALIPLIRLTADWVQLRRVVAGDTVQMTGRGFDWVHWEEDEGIIYAAYVLPQGPASHAGIEDGDVFFMLEGQQYFNVEDLQRAIEGIPPGARRTYFVQRGGEFVEANVRFTRYPTFLYPLSGTLWHFSVWGFLVAAFIHVVGLVIVGPLSLRSRRARFSLFLILASSLWIFGNLLRLLAIELFGPPMELDTTYDALLQSLTVIGIIGWIGFPALLVHRVLGDLPAAHAPAAASRPIVYLPALILGGAALVTTVRGNAGPITVDGLVAPILFYVCCYIATAGMLMLIRSVAYPAPSGPSLSTWSRWGTAVMIVLALLFGLSVLGVVPIFGVVTETMAGWLIVAAQLLAVAPVILVSHATLKHGKVGQVLSRGLTYLIVSGLVFFAFVGGLSLMEPYLQRMESSGSVVIGLFAVVLLIGVEWIVRHLRGYGMSLFAPDRRDMYQAVQHLQEQMRSILDYETLVQRAVQVVGKAFGTRSAVVFLRPEGPSGSWVTGTYHPEPPYLTERVVSSIWLHIGAEGRIWARNPELNEIELPDYIHDLLVARGAAIVIPIMGKDELIGLIALGGKAHRRAVYNLEELDLLRSLAGQLALAVERLRLVERERSLVRETAEAQLVALRAQINPHFLFNSLNTIVSLIEERPDEAEEVVEHLAAIFRYILQTGSRAYVTMEDEFQLIHHYLCIEQSRFGGALAVEQHLPPEHRSCLVPAFAVQTIVENAVKHGVARRRGGGLVRIECRSASDGGLEVVVSDTGAGIPDLFERDRPVTGAQSFFGMGLRNVSARLEQLYGRGDLLSIRSDPNSGTTVSISVPEPDDDSSTASSAAPSSVSEIDRIRVNGAPDPGQPDDASGLPDARDATS